MKINLLLALLLSVSALTIAPARAQTSRNAEPDEIAIRKVLDASGIAADKRDINAFAACFVDSPELYYQIKTADDQLILAHGMANMKKMVGGYMQSAPAPATPAGHQATDYRVRVNGNMATATMNDVSGNETSRMQVVLEKTTRPDGSGDWKILTLTGTYYQPAKLTEVK